MTELDRLALLQDDVRRRLYEYVRAQGEPVSREQAARAVRISRSLAAYHLDRLAEEGFLSADYRRPEGAGGPGAGRPAKRYVPADREVNVSVPARDYEFAAALLAEAAESEESGTARSTLHGVALRRGRDLGRELAPRARSGGLRKALRERGYEPFEDEDGVLRLRNCPFHRLAAEHRDLVCGMNLSFLDGLLEGLGRDDLEGRLEPAPGRCCVAIRSRGSG